MKPGRSPRGLASRADGSPGGLAVRAGVLRDQVFEALGGVYDPELDEPITELGFVGSCAVSPAGDVDVVLRLPTPQCAPNFAWLMVSDARECVSHAPGVGAVSVWTREKGKT